MSKRKILLLCVAGSITLSLFAQPVDSLWARANSAYMQADFQEACDVYTAIYNQGFGSAPLYYNLGNCAFKLAQYAKAVLWYERAKLLEPQNPDILYNLDLVNRFCLDKIENPPEFFLHTWIKEVRDSFSPNQWAWGSLLLLSGSALLLLLFFFGRSRGGRRLAFYLSLLAFLLCICAFSLGWSQKRVQNRHDYAVVMTSVAYIKSAPDQQGKDLFIIHEGAKMRILDQVGGWARIELADRRQGWMELQQAERI
ncbi:MAG: tetratricopeptide repeat protein [Bacteroidetes bacterium]|nr:tetratricopeptide repeat protein [Bacteroidota bacterium]